jgi:hypothetical protein
MSSMPAELAGADQRGFGAATNIGCRVLGNVAIAYRLPVMRTSASEF